MDEILDKIHRAAIKFLHPLDTEILYKTIVKEAVNLVDAKYGSLILLENGTLKRVHSTLPQNENIPIRAKGLAHQAFVSRKAFVKHSEENNTFHQSVINMGIKSNIYIPLSNKGRSIGVLVVNSCKDQSFTEAQLSILKLFGTFASIAIRKNQLYDEVRTALETRDLFISMAAHEIRTPLTTLSGYAQLLQAKLSGVNTPESRWADEMSWETFRLSMLVNELLEVSRIKSGKFQYTLKEVSLKNVIQRAVNSFQFSYPDRKIIFKDGLESKSDFVVGDFDKLLQVVTNLLDNAIKYSPPTSDVTISLSYKSPYMVLKVEDKGKGISKKDLPKIFEGYYRGEERMSGGMGLGLYLTKHIIDKHRGLIHVNSKLNKGTTMEIKLPGAEKKNGRADK